MLVKTIDCRAKTFINRINNALNALPLLKNLINDIENILLQLWFVIANRVLLDQIWTFTIYYVRIIVNKNYQ